MVDPDVRHATILVVDDSPENRYVVRRTLTRAGMNVTEADTGTDGLARAAEDPDLIILDVNLPDFSGYELCRRLKADPKTAHVPVIHLSQSAVDDDARVRGLDGGADAYLTDPIHGSVLVATVRALLRMRAAEDQLRQAASDAERLSDLAARLAMAENEMQVVTALLDALTDPFTVERAFLFPPRPWARSPELVYPPGSEPSVTPPPAEPATVAELLDQSRTIVGGFVDALYDDSGEQPWMVLPLVAYGRELGALLVEFAEGIELPKRNQIRLVAAAERCAQALERAMLFNQQRQIALDLQASLLPARLPKIPGMTLAAEYRPGASGTIVGGDFYDVFASTNGWTAMIGDVCGRGASAAARTSLTRHTAREAARHDDDPEKILDALASAIDADRRIDRHDLISAVCIRLSTVPDGVLATFAIAGHPRPILITAAGEVSEVGHSGTILGFSTDGTYTTTELLLVPGDTLFLYTDGLTESRHDGELFGEERLMSLLQERVAADAPVSELARAPVTAAAAYNAAHDDDMATLVIRATAA